MKTRRHDAASNRTWFRAERVFRCNGDWYFRTREDIDVGPYATEFEAQVESSILKDSLKQAASQAEACRIIREFLLESVSLSRDLDRRAYVDYVVKEGGF